MEPSPNQAPINQPQPASPVRYCLYARKSTESDERQALSIDAQIKEMLNVAQRDDLQITEIRQESHSAKASGQRPVYNKLIEDVRSGLFNGILTWAPDRLSRNAGDLGSLVDLMDQKLLTEIRTYNQKFINSPNEKFLLMILCSQAKLENDNKSLNVKRGLKARVEMGWRPGSSPTGYLNDKNIDHKCQLLLDPNRAPIIKKMFEKIAYEGWSGRKLYYWLKEEVKFTTKYNKPLALSNIYLLLRNTFYTGKFEFPKHSNNWYLGKHQSIISQALFDKVQERLKKDANINPWGAKEFAFTKLITCGHCGSGVTAMEKFKKTKNTVHRYVYYGCTRAKDRSCKYRYVREEEIISQLIKIIGQLDLDELEVREKMKNEIDRYNKFQGILGLSKNGKQVDLDLKKYVIYLLKEGTSFEKREILSCLKSKLVLVERELKLVS
ncbi:MAG: recombinase family protein [Patescibacteria group bacterium]|jgi:DNA invertase Pin-like site-specific DNA recombinase